MLPYLFVAIWPLIMMRFYHKTRIENQNRPSLMMLICTALPMFLLIAFRNELIGADTLIYNKHFVESLGKTVHEMSEVTRMETGYLVFVRLVGSITSSPQIYQLICSCIYMIGFLSFAKNLRGTDAFLFFYFVCTLGLFLFFFTGVRQCIAISICLFSYQYILKKKYLWVLLLLLLAYTFHKSSILFTCALFISNKNLKWYNYMAYMILVLLIGKYLLEIQMWFNESLDYSYEIENVGGGHEFLFLLILMTYISYLMINKNENNNYATSLFNINILTLVFWILRLQTRVAERPSFYFLAFSCALFAFSLNKLPKGSLSMLYKYSIILIAFLLYVYRLATNFSSFIPYSSFL